MKFPIPNSQFQISHTLFFVLVFMGLFWSHQTQAVTLFSGSANQVVYEDQTFVVDWYLDTANDSVNSISLKLRFTAETLEVVEATPGNSLINLWLKNPEFSNSDGTVELIGGAAGGFKSSKFPLFRTVFRAHATGPASMTMDPSSTVLLSDGLGTQTSLLFHKIEFPVVAAANQVMQALSTTHPQEDIWYREHKVVVNFQPKIGEDYSYSFSSNVDLFPDDTKDDIAGDLVFDNLIDGIYYFKLNSRVGQSNWQEATVKRFQIDTTPPEVFVPVIAQDKSVFDNQPFVSFATIDKVSGLAYYEVKTGSLGSWTRTSSTYFKLPSLIVGDEIWVKAVDLAGNEREAKVTVGKNVSTIKFSKWLIWPIIIIGIIVVYLVFRFYVKKRKQNEFETKITDK